MSLSIRARKLILDSNSQSWTASGSSRCLSLAWRLRNWFPLHSPHSGLEAPRPCFQALCLLSHWTPLCRELLGLGCLMLQYWVHFPLSQRASSSSTPPHLSWPPGSRLPAYSELLVSLHLKIKKILYSCLSRVLNQDLWAWGVRFYNLIGRGDLQCNQGSGSFCKDFKIKFLFVCFILTILLLNY